MQVMRTAAQLVVPVCHEGRLRTNTFSGKLGNLEKLKMVRRISANMQTDREYFWKIQRIQ